MKSPISSKPDKSSRTRLVLGRLSFNGWPNMVKVLVGSILIGLLGVVTSFMELGLYLEEEIGLATLFTLRGEIPAPANVAIVSLDKASAEILHLSENPQQWPREYYMRLLEKINQQKPTLVAFNIAFSDSRDLVNDGLLAAEIAKNENVILSNRLKQDTLDHPDRMEEVIYEQVIYEQVINPLDALESAALDVAPFPIPKSDSTIKTFWTYKHSAGDMPTFPVSIFQHYAFKTSYPELVTFTRQHRLFQNQPWPTDYLTLTSELKVAHTLTLQRALMHHPPFQQVLQQAFLSRFFSDKNNRLLTTWLALTQAPETLYLNYYGNSGAIATIPFYQLLLPDKLSPVQLTGKIVLVGYAETIEPDMNQGFYTVFSKRNGKTVSNIELAATGVANLLERSWIVPLQEPYRSLLVFAWGALLVVLYGCGYFRRPLLLIMLLGIGYAAAMYWSFIRWYVWLPFIPLSVQLPLVIAFMAWMQHLKNKQAKDKLHSVFSHYLPQQVVSDLTLKTGPDALLEFGELMQGVCLATDAGQYTSLSELLDPLALHQLMNRYYAIMFAAVRRYQGVISDVVGDAAIVLWAKPKLDRQFRVNACHAALAISEATSLFNQKQPHQLMTRIGLHSGEMRLGNVGAVDHFEYRAVGDTVNTANRIESLNKLLGTKILASAAVLENLPDFCSREIGTFILKGKTQPIRIFELMGCLSGLGEESIALQRLFTDALGLYKSHQWAAALAAFRRLNNDYPEDGPCRFYCQYLQQSFAYLTTQPPSEYINWIDSESLLRS